MKKNNSIEFFRYLMMVVLIAWHSRLGVFSHGYLVVEFFFILSGFLIYRSFFRQPIGCVQFTIKRIKRTYVAYVIGCLFAFSLIISHKLLLKADAFLLMTL